MIAVEVLKHLMEQIFQSGTQVEFWIRDNGILAMTVISGSNFRIHLDLNHYSVAQIICEHANYIMKQMEQIVQEREDIVDKKVQEDEDARGEAGQKVIVKRGNTKMEAV